MANYHELPGYAGWPTRRYKMLQDVISGFMNESNYRYTTDPIVRLVNQLGHRIEGWTMDRTSQDVPFDAHRFVQDLG